MITVYETRGCVQCRKVKNALTAEGVKFSIKDLTEEIANEGKERGWMQAPYVVDDKNAHLSFSGSDQADIDRLLDEYAPIFLMED